MRLYENEMKFLIKTLKNGLLIVKMILFAQYSKRPRINRINFLIGVFNIWVKNS